MPSACLFIVFFPDFLFNNLLSLLSLPSQVFLFKIVTNFPSHSYFFPYPPHFLFSFRPPMILFSPYLCRNIFYECVVLFLSGVILFNLVLKDVSWISSRAGFKQVSTLLSCCVDMLLQQTVYFLFFVVVSLHGTNQLCNHSQNLARLTSFFFLFLFFFFFLFFS